MILTLIASGLDVYSSYVCSARIYTATESFLLHSPALFANVSGILIGTLTMELGGVVSVSCEKTGYHAELEFKLKVWCILQCYCSKSG